MRPVSSCRTDGHGHIVALQETITWRLSGVHLPKRQPDLGGKPGGADCHLHLAQAD